MQTGRYDLWAFRLIPEAVTQPTETIKTIDFHYGAFCLDRLLVSLTAFTHLLSFTIVIMEAFLICMRLSYLHKFNTICTI